MGERTDVIRSLPILAQLSGEELETLMQQCEERHYEKGDTIVEEHVRGEGLFVLDQGTVEVFKGRGRKRVSLATLHRGDHFGEISLITEAPTSAAILASSRVTCLFIPADRFRSVIDEHPTIGRKVLWAFAQTLSKRLVETDRQYVRQLRWKFRSSSLRHLWALFRLQWRITFSYLWVWFRRKLRLGHKPEKLSRIHRRNARRFKETAFKLKGANVKIGQLASLQVHLLPPEYIDEFKAMRDSVPATDYSLIAGLIHHEFGVGPLEVFADFDKVPIAAASMGQVHAARLKSGEKVAVKILHPGLERSVEIDLKLLRRIFRVLSWFVRRIDLMKIYKEAEEPLRKELDLVHEAKATEEIGQQLATLDVKVPKVHWRYSTRRVLTLEFIDGTELDDLEQMNEWGVDRKKLIQSYGRSFLHQAFEGGYFHCDPHPANCFATPEGQLVMLDFGMVKRLPDEVREGLLKEILGGVFNNPKLYADGLIGRGVLGEEDRQKVEAFAAEAFVDPKVRSALFDHDIKKDGDLREFFGTVSDLVKQCKTFKQPTDQLMFLRALGIVIDVAKEVAPETPVSELVMPVIMPIFQRFLVAHPEYAQMPAAKPSK